MTPPSEQLKEISPQGRLVIQKLKNSLKKSNPNKKVMSDTKECCVCYEATEHLTPNAITCVCESCYSQIPTCPMCRASLEEEDSDFDIDEANQGMFEAAFFGHFNIDRLMLSQGANAYNMGLTSAALRGHLDIVLLMLLQRC